LSLPILIIPEESVETAHPAHRAQGPRLGGHALSSFRAFSAFSAFRADNIKVSLGDTADSQDDSNSTIIRFGVVV